MIVDKAQHMKTLNRVIQTSKKVMMNLGGQEYVAEVSVWNYEEIEKLKKKLLELALEA